MSLICGQDWSKILRKITFYWHLVLKSKNIDNEIFLGTREYEPVDDDNDVIQYENNCYRNNEIGFIFLYWKNKLYSQI